MMCYTSNISYRGDKPVLNVTVKSGDKTFAPTWAMVMGGKKGTVTDEGYIKRYYAMMRESYRKKRGRWEEILNMKEMVLVCYCIGHIACHRTILKDIFVKCGAVDGGGLR